MIDVVIVEDEKISSTYLKDLLESYHPNLFRISAVLESVLEATEWFLSNKIPDLIFMDVKLSDGNSFEIFKRVAIEDVPIIYTTAHDDFAINAIKNNGLDYLLKPIDKEEFYGAVNAFFKKSPANTIPVKNAPKLAKTPEFLLTKLGTKYIPIDLDSIAYLYKDDLVFIRLFDGKNYPISKSLSELEKILPVTFFRANRQMIINIKCIDHLYQHKPGQLILKTNPKYEKPIILSQEKSSIIKELLGY